MQLASDDAAVEVRSGTRSAWAPDYGHGRRCGDGEAIEIAMIWRFTRNNSITETFHTKMDFATSQTTGRGSRLCVREVRSGRGCNGVAPVIQRIGRGFILSTKSTLVGGQLGG